MKTTVFADLRWPRGTGIGAVKSALLARAPEALEILDLQLTTRIGSPLSPLAISWALSRRRPRSGVFWSPGYMPPLTSSLPAVVTVHDLTHLHYYTRLHAGYYNQVMRPLYRRCRAVICVSEYTRGVFLEWSGASPDRVHTVRNGISSDFFDVTGDFGLEFPYVLYPGNRRSYKNLGRALRAYASSRLPREGLRFVLTGPPDAKIQSRAASLGVGQSIHFVGHVEDADVVRLYRGATAVVFVSLYEGFGLPIVEAMAAGIPVLTSNAASMPEVAGDAALLVDPTAVDAIAAGLERITFDNALRADLVQRGRQRARSFDWNIAAARVWEIVQSVGQCR